MNLPKLFANAYFTKLLSSTIQLFVVHRDEFNLNNNSGHNEKNSSNKLLAVQTPANDFTVNIKSVSYDISVLAVAFIALHLDCSLSWGTNSSVCVSL